MKSYFLSSDYLKQKTNGEIYRTVDELPPSLRKRTYGVADPEDLVLEGYLRKLDEIVLPKAREGALKGRSFRVFKTQRRSAESA